MIVKKNLTCHFLFNPICFHFTLLIFCLLLPEIVVFLVFPFFIGSSSSTVLGLVASCFHVHSLRFVFKKGKKIRI